MNSPITTTEKKTYIKCKKCGMEIHQDTHKKMTACKCGLIQVDGCEDYARVLGGKENYSILVK
jgi:ribosomal protein L37E